MKDVFVRNEQIRRYSLLDEAVIRVAREMLDVREVTGNEVIDRDDAMTLREQTIGQVRAKKAGAAGDDGDGLLTGMRGYGAVYLVGGGLIGEDDFTTGQNPQALAGSSVASFF